MCEEVLNEAEDLHPDYQLVKTKETKYTSAHPDGKPVYELHHKGKKLSTISPYSAYKDKTIPGKRYVASRKDITKYGATHEKHFNDILPSSMRVSSLGFSDTTAKNVAHNIIRYHQNTLKEETLDESYKIKSAGHGKVHVIRGGRIVKTFADPQSARIHISKLAAEAKKEMKEEVLDETAKWKAKKDEELKNKLDSKVLSKEEIEAIEAIANSLDETKLSPEDFKAGVRRAGTGSDEELKKSLTRKRTGPGSRTIRKLDKEELSKRK